MLILTRRCEDEIVIDDQVRLKVISTSGNRVKIGVTAPPDIPIRRCEGPAAAALDCGPLLVPESEAVAG